MKPLIALAAALALAIPASAEAKPCYPTYCSHSLWVGKTPVHWQTPRVARLTRLDVRFGQRTLDYWNEGCVSYASGYGLTVSFNGCGPGAQHVRVTAVSLRRNPARIRIIFG